MRITSSIYVEAIQFPVPYHSHTPPTRTRTYVRDCFSSSTSKKREDGEEQSKPSKEEVALRAKIQRRKSLQKDVADKLGNNREL